MVKQTCSDRPNVLLVEQSSLAGFASICGPSFPGVASTSSNTGACCVSQCTCSLKRSASRLCIISRIWSLVTEAAARASMSNRSPSFWSPRTQCGTVFKPLVKIKLNSASSCVPLSLYAKTMYRSKLKFLPKRGLSFSSIYFVALYMCEPYIALIIKLLISVGFSLFSHARLKLQTAGSLPPRSSSPARFWDTSFGTQGPAPTSR